LPGSLRMLIGSPTTLSLCGLDEGSEQEQLRR
jgi:hypothetical protein